MRRISWLILVVALLPLPLLHAQEATGSVRGVVYDADFDVPLEGVEVVLVETGQSTTTSAQGTFLIPGVVPGNYTVVFHRPGHVRKIRADVLVTTGKLTDLDTSLDGDFTDMDAFVVQDVLRLESGAEAALLKIRFDSPALMDSIGSDLMSRAGASDAASALKLVSGATVQDGKFAVIRGLPDRYVSSQLNGARLPSADEDKRAVELDQFPSAVIESIQVSKTFTPDQQGDASGGAVDVRLKSLPDEPIFKVSAQVSGNTQSFGRDDFLTHAGGGVGTWGKESGSRGIQYEKLGASWDGPVSVTEGAAPLDLKLSVAGGSKFEVRPGLQLGGFASLFYERDSSFHENGVNDSYWIIDPGGALEPETKQGSAEDGNFKTALLDVSQASESVQWGGLASIGLETEQHRLGLTYLRTHTAENQATLALDTRGKEYYFPGYDPNDPEDPGNNPKGTFGVDTAPYLRTETLEYSERTLSALQLRGEHEFVSGGLNLDWMFALSSASLDEPDKRQFGALWTAPTETPEVLPFQPASSTPATWSAFKPAATFSLGNLQRTWKTIEEDSTLYRVDLEIPIGKWNGDEEGHVKFGLFSDQVDRRFNQDSFSNFGDSSSSYVGEFWQPWSAAFGNEDHPITAADIDIDYTGEIDIFAWYGMIDVPLSKGLNLVTGARVERTDITVAVDGEPSATWLSPGFPAPPGGPVALNPGDADVDLSEAFLLPSIGLSYEPFEELTLRTSFGRTIARQTFKELTPILQQDFLGAPIFVGNPELRMSKLENYDIRADYRPYEGGLFSLSWFQKNIEDPIEYVQRISSFSYTTARNYPKGRLRGYELEARQDLGHFWEPLGGLSLGGNATFIDARVSVPADETAAFALPNIQIALTERDMTQAPEYLYNLYATYEIPETHSQFAVFYTVKGDTLAAGAGVSANNYIPSLYEKEYGTLNASFSTKLGPFGLKVQAKNLTNPDIQSVYRHSSDVIHTSYTRGTEFSFGLSMTL